MKSLQFVCLEVCYDAEVQDKRNTVGENNSSFVSLGLGRNFECFKILRDYKQKCSFKILLIFHHMKSRFCAENRALI